MPAEHKHISRFFVLWWALATAAGTALGLFLFFFTIYFSTLTKPLSKSVFGEYYFLYAGLLFGSFIGIFQWLLLKKYILRAYLWIIATIIGFSLGGLALVWFTHGVWLLLLLLVGAGLVLGLIQYFILREHSNRAWIWLIPSLFSCLTFFCLLLIGDVDQLARNITIAALFSTGLISGAALRYILSKPKTKTPLPQSEAQ